MHRTVLHDEFRVLVRSGMVCNAASVKCGQIINLFQRVLDAVALVLVVVVVFAAVARHSARAAHGDKAVRRAGKFISRHSCWRTAVLATLYTLVNRFR